MPLLWLLLLAGGAHAAPTRAPDAGNATLLRDVRISVRVEGDGRDARIELPLVVADEHQELLSEELTTRGFAVEQVVRDGNRLAILTFPKLTGRKRITYAFRVRTHATAWPLEPAPFIDPADADADDRPWLRPTRYLQSSSPLMRERLARYATPRLEAGESDAIQIAWDLASTGYVKKAGGSRNVLKATRTGHASDKGLDRLLATFLRTSGVPARPVGGIDLGREKGKRGTSWVEVRSGGRFVPMSVGKGLRGELPARFLKLYHGDRPLLSRDGVAKASYRIKVTRPEVPAP